MEWKRVRNLGSKALFINPYGEDGFYSTTTGSSSSSSLRRILSNSIYFTGKKDSYLYRFDMKEKSISATLPCPHLDSSIANSVWVMPHDAQYVKKSHIMKMEMKMQMQGQNRALHRKRKDILEEDSKKGDYFLPILSKVVKKYSYYACTVGALVPLLVLFVKKYKMKLGMVISGASIGALLRTVHVI